MTTEASAPPSSPSTPVDIPAVVAGLRKTFASGRTRDVAWRKQQLEAFERMIVDKQRWRYDEKTKHWHNVSGLPDITQH